MKFLEIESLKVGYGDLKVLQGVTLHVENGELVSLVGSNGAGKSTLLNAISRLVETTSGSIKLDGVDVLSKESHDLAPIGLIQVPEGRRLFPRLSVIDNLKLGAYHKKARAKTDESLERVHKLMPILSSRSSQLAGTLSGGEQQMLAIGRALMGLPRLLILDEPSLGLAPKIVSELFELIQVIRGEGTAILLVEQNVRHALKISDRGYCIQRGEVVLTGTGAELLASSDLTSAMLGTYESK